MEVQEMRIRHLAVVGALLALFVAAPLAEAQSTNTAKLRNAVTLEGMLEHEQKFQQIADVHQGNRAAATVGYEASVAYVKRRLEDAGYRVRLEPFDYPTWEENSPPLMEQVSPNAKTYVPGRNPEDDDNPAVDFITFEFSASGDVTAAVIPTNDIVIPPAAAPDGNTSGCESTDFPAETAGNISLIQRGTCPFVQKLANAEEAGAVGVILFNEGNPGLPGRENVIARSAEPHYPIPAVGASFAVGQELYDLFTSGQSPTVHLVVDATTHPRVQHNVVADSTRGDPENVVVVGGHLDSVPAGPGINDNGSGVSAILEMAEEISELNMKPRNQLRFAFWGAEEAGLIGSSQYVAQLTAAEREDILLNLNFDMLASPNFARYVYDGNTDETPPPEGGAPPGSDVIEQVFLDYFDSQGLPTQPTPFDGRSDYGPFIAQGIPAGGLFSGAEDPKTAEQVALFGGVEGEQLDPCYHEECDTYESMTLFPPGLPELEGNGLVSFDQMSDAVAHASWHFASAKNPLGAAATTASAKQLQAYDLKFKGNQRTER
jgi:Zn-dependent M28 family amino/carboxypeptidase